LKGTHVLNFDQDRFLRIQAGALAQAEGIHRTIGGYLEAGAANLFFLGSGGAGILMMPAVQLLQDRSTLPVHLRLPAELVELGSVHLGPQSIVVIPSLSGTTKESVKALSYCQDRGAKVVTLTGHADTPLADLADDNFLNFAEDDTSCESFYLQSLLVALSVLHHRGESTSYVETVEQLTKLPNLLLEVKRSFESRASSVADHIAEADFHIITGAGNTWPEAWYYGMCILEEMQWIRTRPVHASDFFHGTLELVEKGVSVILFKGEDGTRPLVQRVEKFVPTVTDSVLVLDTAEFDLPGVTSEVRSLLSPVLLATVLERVSAHLEVKRDHPLTTRRYYKRLAY
jgi:fructoselysine-6-phosphate deglycase